MNLKENETNSKGITLIVLVITIIVLLILAGVSIATLTGESGILKKANNAKTSTIVEEEKEQIKLAYNVVMANKMYDGNKEKIVAKELETELKKQNPEVIVTNKIIEEKNTIKVMFNKTGNIYIVDVEAGNIIEESKKSELEKAKEEQTKFDIKTTLKDEFGNKVVVPEGFKIASDSATDVTGGVVIEDITTKEDGSASITTGSQFVWIPVGDVNYSEGKKTIHFDRYTFDDKGAPNPQGNNTIANYYNEEKVSTKGNAVAKDIEAFKNSVKSNGGYYIGRYEARTIKPRTSKNDVFEAVTVKPNDYVYNYIDQLQASKQAQAMYNTNKSSFASDLINSYAWDTTLVFLQEFDNRSNKTKKYSIQSPLNTKFAEKGTNHLVENSQQDKICNVWDMASNEWEWTTETSSNHNDNGEFRAGGVRGGVVYYEGGTMERNTSP